MFLQVAAVAGSRACRAWNDRLLLQSVGDMEQAWELNLAN